MQFLKFYDTEFLHWINLWLKISSLSENAVMALCNVVAKSFSNFYLENSKIHSNQVSTVPRQTIDILPSPLEALCSCSSFTPAIEVEVFSLLQSF